MMQLGARIQFQFSSENQPSNTGHKCQIQRWAAKTIAEPDADPRTDAATSQAIMQLNSLMNSLIHGINLLVY
jgi:hypothetical protein